MILLYGMLNDVYLGRDYPVDKILRDLEYQTDMYRRHFQKSKFSMIEDEVERKISEMLKEIYDDSDCTGDDNG